MPPLCVCVSNAQVYNALTVGGHAATLVYAKLDFKQFRAVNTTKGPWVFLDALDWVNVHIDMPNDMGNRIVSYSRQARESIVAHKQCHPRKCLQLFAR